MARQKRTWAIVAIVIGAALLAVWLILSHAQKQRDYALIREAVADRGFKATLTEEARSRATECYPEEGSTPVCQQIRYSLTSEQCLAVLKVLSPEDSGVGGNCKSVHVDQTYKKAKFKFTVGEQDGQQNLIVTFVSKE